MLNKLRKFPAPPEDDRINDLTMLSPAEQDRVDELVAKIDRISDKEFTELNDLFESAPLISRDGPLNGPDLNIPRGLASYWRFSKDAPNPRSYDFWGKLKAVQKVRFVELCRQNGWRGGYWSRTEMRPLDTWGDKDYHEMTALLDAASKKTFVATTLPAD